MDFLENLANDLIEPVKEQGVSLETFANEEIQKLYANKEMTADDKSWAKNMFEKIQPSANDNKGSVSSDSDYLLNSEYRDEPDIGKVLVTGSPFEIGEKLDDHQGDNSLNYKGNCGLVSVTNLLRMAGIGVTEDDITNKAKKYNCVNHSIFNKPESNGGTTDYHRQKLIESFGIKCNIINDKNGLGSLESIAGFVESGHGVSISTNAGYEWNEALYINDGKCNHSIVVTGTARDITTGELKGLYVCDSGLVHENSKAKFLSVETLQKCYIETIGASALVTDKPVR